MQRFITIVPFALGSVLSACSNEESPKAATEESIESGAPAAEDEILFSSDEFTVAPGDEKYMCWAHNLPADRDVVLREISGDYGRATHHVFFAWTLLPEPEGMTECPVLFKLTWIPIYLGGVDTSPLTVPAGAGIDLDRGKQLLLQLHMQNTTPEPIVNKVTMRMKVHEPGAEFVPAGIFGMDNRAIDVPPKSEGTSTAMTCKPGRDMEVFSILGHMHKLGSALQVSHSGQVVFDQAWDFEEQPITPFQLTVGAEDELGLRCTHRNPNAFPITYGESSDNEMCATIFYYTPYDELGGCVNAPTAATSDAGTGDAG